MATPIQRICGSGRTALAAKRTYKQVAELFREKGALTPDLPDGGPRRGFLPMDEKTCAGSSPRTPTARSWRLHDEWQRRFGVESSCSAMQRALLNAGLIRKRFPTLRAESPHVQERRAAFVGSMAGVAADG